MILPGFRSLRMALLLAAACAVGHSTAVAQTGEYHEPLNEKLPPGLTAETLARVRHYDASWLQPVRVELPSSGTVSVYSASPEPLATIASPAQFSVSAGHVYRLRISDLPEFPGMEIYPSIEILDRLHPPAGMAANYPIPIVLTEADLREAIEERLVSRIIYLENPRNAVALDPLRGQSPQLVRPTENALQEAGKMGRPMIIVRIGGRVPSGDSAAPYYYGTGGPFDLDDTVPANTGVVRLTPRKPARGVIASQRP